MSLSPDSHVGMYPYFNTAEHGVTQNYLLCDSDEDNSFKWDEGQFGSSVRSDFGEYVIHHTEKVSQIMKRRSLSSILSSTALQFSESSTVPLVTNDDVEAALSLLPPSPSTNRPHAPLSNRDLPLTVVCSQPCSPSPIERPPVVLDHPFATAEEDDTIPIVRAESSTAPSSYSSSSTLYTYPPSPSSSACAPSPPALSPHPSPWHITSHYPCGPNPVPTTATEHQQSIPPSMLCVVAARIPTPRVSRRSSRFSLPPSQ